MNKDNNIKINGAEIILKCLEEENVDTIFGYPGGAVLPLYDALYKNKNIRHILTRHEQGAGHAADGYARVTGRTGVAFATSGPGATNLVTAIATAQMDSIPLVCITGQVARHYLGKQSFQESNIVDIVKPITKYSYQIKNVEELATEIKKAFRIAGTGRKGPVLIDVPKDITVDKAIFEYPVEVNYKVEKWGESEHTYQLVAKELMDCKKPLIFIGGGAQDASDEVKELAERLKSPVTYSLMGKGVLSDKHPLNIGMIGMHGTGAANYAVSECDLMFAIGVRFDDRQTGDEINFAKNAKIIHLDIDKKEFNKNIRGHIHLHDDSAIGLFKLLKVMKEENYNHQKAWLDQIETWKVNHPLVYLKSGMIKPQEAIEAINVASEGKAYVTTEVGQHQMWSAQYYEAASARHFITSGGLGTMGFGLPAAMGVQLGKEGELVVAIAGDGSIQMNIQELMTISANNMPIKIVLLNNKSLGMVRQWQKMFFEERYSCTLFKDLDQPDFVMLANAYGIKARRISERADLIAEMTAAFKEDGPQFIEVVVDSEENVFPMVPAGAANDRMIFE
ncbi:MAG: biosynthetic-type acetolactate synthase large subunit [Firmicutes bacterium]|nr:biosynthetic-type acetolactate synthase large subunit [Bacillota bacterium]